MKLPLLSSLLIAILLGNVIAPRSQAAPGDLDPTFGIGGKVESPVRFMDDVGAVRVQDDGKLLVAGYTSSDYVICSLAVTRYHPDGALDTSFGTGGVASTLIDGGNAGNVFHVSMALQVDGRIVVSGSWGRLDRGNIGALKRVIVRYLPSGELDASFGSAGVVEDTDTAYSWGKEDQTVAVQSDGKIVLIGASVIARYHSDGTRDNTFGSGGMVLAGPKHRYKLESVALQSDGKILASGYHWAITDPEQVIFRFAADGAPDSSFGIGGKLTVGRFWRLTLQDDDKILTSDGASVTRYYPDGTLDTGFGTDGTSTAVMIPGSDHREILQVAAQDDGRVIVAGSVFLPIRPGFWGHRFFVARYTDTGALDAGFGSGGLVTTRFGQDNNHLQNATLQSDGKIVLIGMGYDWFPYDEYGPPRAIIARYCGGNPPPPAELALEANTTTLVAPEGATVASLSSAAVNVGTVGGLATVRTTDRRAKSAIYGGEDGAVLVSNGEPAPGDRAGRFFELEHPVFGAGGVGFAAAVEPDDGSQPARGLWAQLSVSGGESILAQVAVAGGSAPDVTDGVFSRFRAFGLPRRWPGLVFLGQLTRQGETSAANDLAVWRQRDGAGSELLLRNGSPVQLASGGSRQIKRLQLMVPVANATDQRRSFAPDGGVAVAATYAGGGSGVLRVAVDGGVDAPLETTSAVPGLPGVHFTLFGAPATASGGRYAVRAELDGSPREVIVASLDGSPTVVARRGQPLRSRQSVRFAKLGDPLLSESGAMAWTATLTGLTITPSSNRALIFYQDGQTTVAAQAGMPAPQAGPGVTFRRLTSVVITDTTPPRMLFTATLASPTNSWLESHSFWCFSPISGLTLLLRDGQKIEDDGAIRRVRTFSALTAASTASPGQGRTTDEDGFTTARAMLSNGHRAVLRLPLP